MSRPFISIVVPVFGDGFNASIFYKEIEDALSSWAKFEVIFVNDSYEDENWESIKNLEGVANNIIAICNGKNKGQHYSTKVGLEIVNGDYVVVSDCDGQDNPFDIREMYEYLEDQKYDIIFGQRKKRSDKFFKILISKLFYLFIFIISGLKFDDRTTSFGVAKVSLIKKLLNQGNAKVIYGVSIRKVTNNIGFKKVNHRERKYGHSSYTLSSKIRLALDVIKLSIDRRDPRFSEEKE